jgi:CubicO group peptidase (beta-lactamase class C family)
MARITRRQALACGALSLPVFASNPLGDEKHPKTAIDTILREALEFWDVPGVAVGIVREGKVVYLEGHGVKTRGGKDKVTPNTLFAIASCTKAFTTTAMAILVSEGRMSWDQPVRDQLEYFRLADPSADRLVTLRDLVCHRTGLGSYDLLWYRAAWSPRDAVRRIGRLAPERQFRSSFQYQSTMVAAAGYALEAALGPGARWEDFVRKRLLEPLGMDRTYCTIKEARNQGDFATPYRRDRNGEIVPFEWFDWQYPDPAGSIVSCAADLCKWAILHLRKGVILREGREVPLVNPESLAVTHAPQNIIPLGGHDGKLHPETHQMTYCMGWVRQDYRGQLLLSHGGTLDGFRTHITLVPRAQLGIVLLNNLHGSDMNLAVSNTLVDRILGLQPTRDWNSYIKAVIQEKIDKEQDNIANREKLRHKNTKPSRDLADYTGAYLEPAFGEATVTFEDGKLMWQWSSFKCPLKHFHFDTFIAESEILHDPIVGFALGIDGHVATMNALDRYFVRVPKK